MEYNEYIEAQKKRFSPERCPKESGVNRKKNFTEIIAQHFSFSKSEHCLIIGCANNNEANLLNVFGAQKVTQIDISPNHPGIIEMDMHNLQFTYNTFDYIQMFHCLEHAFDPGKVIREVLRVIKPGGVIAVEVPVNFETTDIDRWDFRDSGCLIEVFLNIAFNAVVETLYSINISVNHSGNFCGTDISRIILKVEK